MSEIKNPFKGATDYGWHFEQEVFLPGGIVRSVKAGGGSGNIPKVVLCDGAEGRRPRQDCMEHQADRVHNPVEPDERPRPARD